MCKTENLNKNYDLEPQLLKMFIHKRIETYLVRIDFSFLISKKYFQIFSTNQKNIPISNH